MLYNRCGNKVLFYWNYGAVLSYVGQYLLFCLGHLSCVFDGNKSMNQIMYSFTKNLKYLTT